jgi:hypothetical protein
MVQRRIVNRGYLRGIERLHEVHLDLERTAADGEDILVHVLALAAEGAGRFDPQRVNPQRAQPQFVKSAHRDLLQAQDPEWPIVH